MRHPVVLRKNQTSATETCRLQLLLKHDKFILFLMFLLYLLPLTVFLFTSLYKVFIEGVTHMEQGVALT